MQISKQQVSLRDEPDYDKLLYLVEQAGRVCYNSESALDRDSGEKFVRRLIKMGHESVLEHATLSFMIETDRATANQIVRHRLLSFSQQSQRYVKYNNLEVIIPEGIEKYSDEYEVMVNGLRDIELRYKQLLKLGLKVEQARAILPQCTKTTIVVSGNIREIRHVLNLRCDRGAQPDIQKLCRGMLKLIHEKYPAFVDDLYEKYIAEKDKPTKEVELGERKNDNSNKKERNKG